MTDEQAHVQAMHGEVLDAILASLRKGESRMDEIEKRVDGNTQTISEMKGGVDSILEIVVMGRSMFKLANYVGHAAKWVGVIAGTAYTFWKIWKGKE